MKTACARCVPALFLLVSSQFVSAVPTYDIQGLGSLGGLVSRSVGINNLGQVVGESTNALGQREAFIWDATNGMQGLGFLNNSSFSRANAINDSGEVVGASFTDALDPANGEAEHFIWDAANGMRSMGSTSNFSVSSEALDINNSGLSVGTSSYDFPASPLGAGGGSQPNLWDATNANRRIPTFAPNPADGTGSASGINEAGTVVGQMQDFSATTPDPAGDSTAFIWDSASGPNPLQHLAPGFFASFANEINDHNDVVGSSADATGRQVAVKWENGTGAPTALGLFDPSDASSFAYAINNEGFIVGTTVNSTLFPQFPPSALATIWENNVAIYLGNLLNDPQDWLGIVDASDINENGQIAGTGVKFNPAVGFMFEAVLLTPSSTPNAVPEPRTISLVLIAMCCLLFRHKLRRFS